MALADRLLPFCRCLLLRVRVRSGEEVASSSNTRMEEEEGRYYRFTSIIAL
jgi:hypothetical protein